MVLALDHDRNAPLVFSPAGGGILTDFPSVPVEPDRPIQDEFVVLGDGGVELELGDRAAADHLIFAPCSILQYAISSASRHTAKS